ncbi:hypothetical protein HY212_03390 [Candidatus Pacearchaeota archaeon]|nr:hypothetical protein [Candidatus Pacearchaeota archaeon]
MVKMNREIQYCADENGQYHVYSYNNGNYTPIATDISLSFLDGCLEHASRFGYAPVVHRKNLLKKIK